MRDYTRAWLVHSLGEFTDEAMQAWFDMLLEADEWEIREDGDTVLHKPSKREFAVIYPHLEELT
jgi:hypothetical protein